MKAKTSVIPKVRDDQHDEKDARHDGRRFEGALAGRKLVDVAGDHSDFLVRQAPDPLCSFLPVVFKRPTSDYASGQQRRSAWVTYGLAACRCSV
jgi:hypothetical protein